MRQGHLGSEFKGAWHSSSASHASGLEEYCKNICKHAPPAQIRSSTRMQRSLGAPV
jgi:hypothetical protein